MVDGSSKEKDVVEEVLLEFVPGPLTSDFSAVYNRLADDLENKSVKDALLAYYNYMISRPTSNRFEPLKAALKAEYGVNVDAMPAVIQTLDMAAVLYAMYATIPVTSPYLKEELEHMKKVERAAVRLRGLLPNTDSPMVRLFDVASAVQAPNTNTTSASQYFEQLDKMLEGLINARKALYRTALGKAYKLGQKSPKGNLATKLWMKITYGIWTVNLSRHFKYDGQNGFNGRKRYLDFAYTCLNHIDPRVEFQTLENILKEYPRCEFDLFGS